MVAIVSQKREAIHRAVRQMYTAVASAPDQDFHFPTGRAACEVLGYPREALDALPKRAVESFAGVGYPFAADVIREGDHVLDIGSGSGTDALLCSKLVGPKGRVYGLDMTERMREKLRAAANDAGAANLEILEGDAEAIPLPDESVDVVTSNGVLNLVPDKKRAIAEIHRVLKPGGRLQIADIALAKPVSERYRQDPQMWAECVVGAVEEERYVDMLRSTGLENVETIGKLDYFGLSSSDKTREVARLFNAHSIALRAVKPRLAKPVPPLPVGKAVANLAGQFAGVGAAVVAWLTCAGFPIVLAAFGAVGASAFTTHAVMFPAFAGMLGASVWLLWRTGRRRGEYRPFWLALAAAVFAVAATWIALVGIYRPLGWWSYAGVAGVVAASAWSFVLSRRPGACVDEMVREERWKQRQGPLGQRIAQAAVGWGAAIAALYGLSASLHAFAGG